MVGTVNVVAAETVRARSADTCPDLHKQGDPRSIRVRRLRRNDHGVTIPRRAEAGAGSPPARLLVQTGLVAAGPPGVRGG